MSVVVPFLENQTFFITGVTGFLGKVLLVKLIETCPNLKPNSICVLVRGKKELSASDRFDKDLFNDSYIIQYLLKKRPDARKCIKVIDGDVAKSKLGLTPSDYDWVCNNATCILHMAATTNFTENLRLAFEINIMGTKRVLALAKSCKNLVSMVYVSTCYTNATRHGGEIREKVYPINFDPYAVIQDVIAMTPEEADKATPHIIGSHPNTYTFSKMLAEHIVLEEKENIPLSIVRPSIIGGAYRYPLEGWIDSYIGAAGIVAASSLGVLHGMNGGGSNTVDFIPVDFVVDLILVTLWHTKENPPGERLNIYHSATSSRNPYTWEHLRSGVVGYYRRRPPKRNVGPVWVLYVQNPALFYLYHFLFTRLPATLQDTKRVLKGESPKMVAGSKVLYKACSSLSFFTLHSWAFAIHNTQALWEALGPEDSKLFPFDVTIINWEIWCPLFCEGIKKYVFKEIELEKKKLVGGGAVVGKAKEEGRGNTMRSKL
eukprot:TRINITY_DN6299_c0_g1_i1.p1 TRINITY_DN6299_c0_g1~~TRINITY_DN6299_c0_g1_i1.p1  ORF type:complete len:487 (+),score=62.86 TRINITY_DN6299_c0_g1_i1:66-1526(+)